MRTVSFSIFFLIFIWVQNSTASEWVPRPCGTLLGFEESRSYSGTHGSYRVTLTIWDDRTTCYARADYPGYGSDFYRVTIVQKRGKAFVISQRDHVLYSGSQVAGLPYMISAEPPTDFVDSFAVASSICARIA